MKILSLFDGISCARVALDRAGLKVDAYYASEIDRYAEQISTKNYPDIKRMGDVKIINSTLLSLRKIDLLIGGSPCQDLSIAKKNRKGLDGERSGLFWEYVHILNEVKPRYFILENVASMPKEAKALITKTLGVEPIMINAALVSAQNRKRLFWTNIPGVGLPEDRNIYLKDVLEDGSNEIWQVPRGFNKGGRKKGKSPTLTSNSFQFNNKSIKTEFNLIARASVQKNAEQYSDGKSPSLTSAMGMGGGNVPLLLDKDTALNLKGTYIDGDQRKVLRKLTPIECERLQGLPDNYTERVSNSQRYKSLGNAFNVDVIAHILSFIPKKKPMPQKKKPILGSKREKVCKVCKHGAKFHYKSDIDVSKDRIICSKDNCTAWDRCDQEGWEEKELLGKHR